MLAPVGMAMALIVTAASIYSFSPRQVPPLQETRIPVDRMQLTTIERSKAGIVMAGDRRGLLGDHSMMTGGNRSGNRLGYYDS